MLGLMEVKSEDDFARELVKAKYFFFGWIEFCWQRRRRRKMNFSHLFLLPSLAHREAKSSTSTILWSIKIKSTICN
jgi:hypothetical protein